MWYGKLIGAVLGLLITRSFIGAIIGAFMGHYFDVDKARGRQRRGAQAVQQVFFRSTFQIMGQVAKSDGRVSEQEIQAARAVMSQFRLSENDIRYAIEYFTQGKARDFPLHQALRELVNACGHRMDLRLMFVQIQLQAVMLGGGLNAANRVILKRCCIALGISDQQFAQMESMQRHQGAASDRGATPLAEAYQVLGVASTASDGEVTKAYRRLMSQNHPDKLVAKGLPESMMRAAEEKTRSILAAYEAISAARGLK